jgi:hypothetical protein
MKKKHLDPFFVPGGIEEAKKSFNATFLFCKLA